MNLYLIRHATAKDIGEDFIQTDFERPLSQKGIQEAKKMASHISSQQIFFDLVLYSPTARTKETADIFCDRIAFQKKQEVKQLAPFSTTEKYLYAIKSNKHIETLAIVGHNPTITDTVHKLVGHESIEYHLKKCSVAIIHIPDVSKTPILGTLTSLIDKKSI